MIFYLSSSLLPREFPAIDGCSAKSAATGKTQKKEKGKRNKILTLKQIKISAACSTCRGDDVIGTPDQAPHDPQDQQQHRGGKCVGALREQVQQWH